MAGTYYGKDGQTIRVVRGVKVPIGTTGIVFWRGETKWGTRLGFKTMQDETVWIAEANVEYIRPFPGREAIVEKAQETGNADGLEILLPNGERFVRHPEAKVVLFQGRVVWEKPKSVAPLTDAETVAAIDGEVTA